LGSVPTLRLFASARDAAGTGSDRIDGSTIDEVLATAGARYGQRFRDVLPTCRIWLNGDEVGPGSPVGPDDEVAVLPPVSGGGS
jgi:molybdopterin synthase sulfur carrier subunit